MKSKNRSNYFSRVHPFGQAIFGNMWTKGMGGLKFHGNLSSSFGIVCLFGKGVRKGTIPKPCSKMGCLGLHENDPCAVKLMKS